ncbi:MAG: hypothetical protein J3K34DRAFT_440639 [Monoraphidium minutum]|nr:MAG: hypothetical protein J3K34DRAFT_440639 [Monoraphidium minutum]
MGRGALRGGALGRASFALRIPLCCCAVQAGGAAVRVAAARAQRQGMSRVCRGHSWDTWRLRSPARWVSSGWTGRSHGKEARQALGLV